MTGTLARLDPVFRIPLPDLPPDPELRLDRLTHLLYRQAYMTCFDGWMETPRSAGPGRDLAPALAAAHPGCARWEEGWRIVAVLPNGAVVAARNAQTRSFLPGQYLTHRGPDAPPSAGDKVTIAVPRSSATASAGFYYAFGSAIEPCPDFEQIRLYWNVQADSAPELLRSLTAALDLFQLPFRFKCLSGTAGFPRQDAAVLYAHPKYAHALLPLALRVHAEIAAGLAPGTPLFTLRLAPGLALAEDPGDSSSFGLHRCRLVARALLRCASTGEESPAGRWSALAAEFQQAGVSLEQPWRRAGSRWSYPLP